jgi:hypothetical protein
LLPWDNGTTLTGCTLRQRWATLVALSLPPDLVLR